MTSVTRRQTGRIGIGRDYCRCQEHKPGLWQRDQFSHHLFGPPELKQFYLLSPFSFSKASNFNTSIKCPVSESGISFILGPQAQVPQQVG